MSDDSSTLDLEAFDAHTLGQIKEYGRSVIGVFGTGREGPNFRPFAYTVGNAENEVPDLIVFNIDLKIATQMLNHISHLIGELPLTHRKADPFLTIHLGGQHPVRLYPVPPFVHEHYTTVTARHYGTVTPVWQVVVCDPFGKFPEDEGCNPIYQNLPLLYKWPGEAPAATSAG